MFKKLKSLFIIEEETVSKQSPVNPEAESVKGDKSQRDPSAEYKMEKPVYDGSNPPSGKLNEKFVDRLLKAIDDQNLDGFDYLEYKQALQNLKNVEMDEQTKFMSALAMAKTMGANKNKLVASAEHYLKVLAEEEKKFVEAFKNQVDMQVNSKAQSVKNIEQSIEQKKLQIEKLKKEIEAQGKNLDKSKAAVEQAKNKVEATKNDFYQAYHIVAEQIRDDLEKIKKFIT